MPNAVAKRENYKEFVVDPDREANCEARLREYLTRVRQEPVDKNVETLFSLRSGVCSRFDYFAPRMPETARSRLLVSGCAAGSEMIIGRKYGFQEVVGTEVTKDYVEITRERFLGQDRFEVILYDGRNLPFANDSFTAVVSGHIIEHTHSPYQYLEEHMRVLAPGGFMFLEFPNRYTYIELHTGLLSLEYLPASLRSLGLRFCASRFSGLSAKKRQNYDTIRRTLQPVSVWQIRHSLRQMNYQTARIIHHYAAARGITRMLIAK